MKSPRTTIAGIAAGIMAFIGQPDIKHALFGLFLAILGTLAHDSANAANTTKKYN